MSCFPCFSSQRSKNIKNKRDLSLPNSNNETKKKKAGGEMKNEAESGNIEAQTFTFRELATATNNFRQECLLGEGGFGRVYKGILKKTKQVVAVKQLDRNGLQGNKEFLVEVLRLSLLHHPNLANLIGYCADGDQRLLIYEFVPGGSLEDHLLEIQGGKVLDWYTRVRIASGAARGLEHLHDKANPPVIYRDLKSSNILLDHDYNPKLSDFGLAKLGPVGDKIHVPSRVMGTYGYCAPEYTRTGQLTIKSDVYSFGVVLLELITGRRAIDTTRPTNQQNLVAWALPLFRDPKKYPEMADPLLKGNFPEKDLNQAVAIAAMCLQEEDTVRPLISDVVTALSFLSSTPPPPPPPSSSPPYLNSEEEEEEEEEEEANKDEEYDKEEVSEKEDEISVSSDGEEEEASKNHVEIQEGLRSPSSSGKRSFRSENESFSSTHVRSSSKIMEKTTVWSRNSSLSSKKSVTNGGSVLSHKTSKADSDRHSNGSSFGSDEGSGYSFSPNGESFMKSFHKKEGSQSGRIFLQSTDNERGSENRSVSF